MDRSNSERQHEIDLAKANHSWIPWTAFWIGLAAVLIAYAITNPGGFERFWN